MIANSRFGRGRCESPHAAHPKRAPAGPAHRARREPFTCAEPHCPPRRLRNHYRLMVEELGW